MRKTLGKAGLAVLALAILAGCAWPDSGSFRHTSWDSAQGRYVGDNRGGE